MELLNSVDRLQIIDQPLIQLAKADLLTIMTIMIMVSGERRAPKNITKIEMLHQLLEQLV